MSYFDTIKYSKFILDFKNLTDELFPFLLHNILGLSIQNDPILVFLVVSILVSILLLLFIPVPLVTLSTILFVEPKISIPSLIIGIFISSYIATYLGSKGNFKLKSNLISKLRNKLSVFSNKRRMLNNFNTVLSVAILRHVPVAPYSIVNYGLGQIGVKPLMVSIGSVLGLLPVIIILALGENLIM